MSIYVIFQFDGFTQKATFSDTFDVDSFSKSLPTKKGLTYQVVNKTTYDATLDSKLKETFPVERLAEQYQSILDAKNPVKTSTERIDAIVKYLGL